jgi:hypothetical protein
VRNSQRKDRERERKIEKDLLFALSVLYSAADTRNLDVASCRALRLRWVAAAVMIIDNDGDRDEDRVIGGNKNRERRERRGEQEWTRL